MRVKKRNFIKHENFLSQIKMAKGSILFGNIENKKNKFECFKNPVFQKDVGIDNILVSSKISFGKRKI